MFQIHDLVVYKNDGVYEITDIGTLHFSADHETQYYTLRAKFSDSDSKVYVPVNSTHSLRSVMDEIDAKNVISKIPDMKPDVINFNKYSSLKEYYLKIMQSPDAEGLLMALKEITMREETAKKKRKRLGQIDFEYKKRLLLTLSQEFATAFSTDVNYAVNRLEESIAD